MAEPNSDWRALSEEEQRVLDPLLEPIHAALLSEIEAFVLWLDTSEPMVDPEAPLADREAALKARLREIYRHDLERLRTAGLSHLFPEYREDPSTEENR